MEDFAYFGAPVQEQAEEVREHRALHQYYTLAVVVVADVRVQERQRLQKRLIVLRAHQNAHTTQVKVETERVRHHRTQRVLQTLAHGGVLRHVSGQTAQALHTQEKADGGKRNRCQRQQ